MYKIVPNVFLPSKKFVIFHFFFISIKTKWIKRLDSKQERYKIVEKLRLQTFSNLNFQFNRFKPINAYPCSVKIQIHVGQVTELTK